MMIVEILYRGIPQQCVLYDIWDIPEEQIVLPHTVLTEDVGKYALYTDGSRMLAKIVHKRGIYFNTLCGLFHKYDYVHICRPKPRMSAYSGLLFHHEHVKLRRPNLKERQTAEAFLAKKLPSNKRLSKRCILLVLQLLQEHMNKKQINEEWIIDKLKKEAENPRNRGADRLIAITMLGRIGGIEMGVATTNKSKSPALFAQFNNYTIQDKRRKNAQDTIDLPTRKDLESAIEVLPEIEDAEIIECEPL